jgi:T5SS/PEP-CTERM-associated repeat protein
LWHIISELTVGFGPNGSLNVQNGGRVESASTRIGFGNITSNGVVTVDGNTSSFSGAGPLYVGDQATGALFVLNGGDVTNTQGWVANQAGSSGEVTVSGPGSTWTNSEFVVIGFYGDGSLSVFNGGQVLNPAGSASIGNRSGSTGTVLVDGPGSAWTNNFTLFVGFEGSGDMTIRNGGSVSNTGSETAIAYSPGSDGTVLVDGAGSSWTNDVLLTVGAGGTGELTIQNGGLVSNTGSQTVIGGSAGSNGKVTVDDASFNVSVTPLVVGVLGTGELVVRNAASAQSADATVGEGPLSRGTVTVQGPDSLWQISGDLTVGDGGIGDLNILDGGEVRNRFANLSTTGGVGSATISGAGSTWINEFDLTIGAAFNSGFMTISDGGAVLSRLSIMGFNSTGRGGPIPARCRSVNKARAN